MNYIILAATIVSHFIKKKPSTKTGGVRTSRANSRVNSEHKFTFSETSVFSSIRAGDSPRIRYLLFSYLIITAFS